MNTYSSLLAFFAACCFVLFVVSCDDADCIEGALFRLSSCSAHTEMYDNKSTYDNYSLVLCVLLFLSFFATVSATAAMVV